MIASRYTPIEGPEGTQVATLPGTTELVQPITVSVNVQ